MKMKFKTGVLLASLSGLASQTTGCGQPKVKVPERDKLVAPALPQGTLSLTDARDDVSTYTGGLVIWDDKIQAGVLSKLLTTTRQDNTLQVKIERTLDSYLERTFEPRKKAIATKVAELISLRKQDDASVDARQEGIAAGWFKIEMTKIVNGKA